MKRNLDRCLVKSLVFLSFFLAGCTASTLEEHKPIQDTRLESLSYSHLEGMSGDIFRFQLMTKSSLADVYDKGKYKYSHFKCEPVQNYVVAGSISIDQERIEHGLYRSAGYFKICADEAMNTCLTKKQIAGLLSRDLNCQLLMGGLLQKTRVIADTIVISKASLLEAPAL